jgi:hypothetical protein
MNPDELRKEFRQNLDPTIKRLNEVLSGQHMDGIEPVLRRIGRGGKVPHWFANLRDKQTLPNLDGKTIGSVVEMLLVGVLETFTFAKHKIQLRVNPARGTDLPDLDLGVKSPSTNYCTSEPFFSAYERLIGSNHDAVILLTDYQEQKENPPLKLHILKWRYLEKTEIADDGLCKLALKNREYLLKENEVWAQKFFRFLAYVNQSDWRAKQLLVIAQSLTKPDEIPSLIKQAVSDFAFQNKKLLSKDRTVLAETDLEALQQIAATKPIQLGVIDALDNWVIENLQEAARMPGSDEWKLLKNGPLNGKIGMSFALQWRYNFGRIFNGRGDATLCLLEEYS